MDKLEDIKAENLQGLFFLLLFLDPWGWMLG